nr:hemerythrin family protein [Sedimentibacter sp.]
MAYKWDKSLETGNATIDEQHKSLINAINDLLDACSKGKGRIEVQKTLKFLSEYVIKHFDDEEKLQIKSKYPDYTAHKKLHEDFKKDVANIVSEFEEGGATIPLVAKVNGKIGEWLIKHIKTMDKKVADHINSIK